MPAIAPPPMTSTEALEKARRVFEIELNETREIANRLDERFFQAIELRRNCIEQRGKIVVVGVGKSGHIGDKIAATLTSTGSPAVVLNSLNAMHGDLGLVASDDVVIALSSSGETEELLNILSALARSDVKIIALTGNQNSSLARAAAVTLDTSVAREACPLLLAPTSSTTGMLVLGDALAMVLLEARGFRKEDFARFHPGGHLGRTLFLRVRQIMRPAERVAIVLPENTVLQAVQEMTRKRCGAAIVGDSSILGIFTQGDFARHFPTTPDIGSRKVAEYMTRNPITINSEALAGEALRLLQEHPIDDLIVTDANNRPLGMVDSQDLSRLQVI